MQYLQGLRDFLYYWFINKKGFGKPEASINANQVSRLKAVLLLALLSLCVDLILKSLTSLERPVLAALSEVSNVPKPTS